MEQQINMKKKGANYTSAEKETLVTIVKEYIGIIESKFTNAENIKKKQNAWVQVAQKFNAVATSGPRTWVQLRHTYANIKQKTRKNVANENKQQYYLKQKAAEDKKNIMKTGGGSFRPALTDIDNQLLALVAPQLTPLQNVYDDAAAYFDNEVTIEGNSNMTNFEKTETQYNEVTIEDKSNMTNFEKTETQYHEILIEEEKTKDEMDPIIIIGENEDIHSHQQSKQTCTKRKGNKKISRNGNKNMEKSTKEKYFQIKLGNAKIERKILLQRYRHDCIKDKLEIQLLKTQIKKRTLIKNIQ